MKLKSQVTLGLIGGLIVTNITCYNIMAKNPVNVEEKNNKSIERKVNNAGMKINKEELNDVKFNPYNLLTPSNATSEDLNKYLETKSSELKDLGGFFYVAEQETGINAIFLASLAGNESAWGTSRICVDKNNLFGFMAFNVQTYDSAMGFKSKGDCILYTAHYLKNNYLDPKGKYYKGKSIWNVNTNYCLKDDGTVNDKWTKVIIEIGNDFEKQINLNREMN